MAERVALGLSTKMDDVSKVDIQDERTHEAVLKELSALSDHPNAIESEKKVAIIIRLWTTLIKTCQKTRYVEEAFYTLLRKTTLAVLTPVYNEINLALRIELFNHIFHCGKLMDPIVNGCLQSCINLIKLGDDPWHNPFVEWEPLLNGTFMLEDHNVQTYLKTEAREIALARVHFLTVIGCEDHALYLVKYILKYHVKLYGCNVWKTEDSPTNNVNAFSCLEWFLFLLQRKKSLPEIVKLTDGLSCHEGVLAIRMLRRKKNCKPLANFLAQVFMVHEILEPKVYCCAKELFRYWCISLKEKNMSLAQVTETTKKLFGQYASSSAHFYLLVDTLWEQFGDSFLQLYIELFIRAFTIDINHLDVARSSGKKNEVTNLEVQLSNMFMKLSTLFSHSHEQVSRECVLSAFSLRPNEERLLVLQTLTHGVLSSQSQNSLWNEDLELAVDNFHTNTVAKNFHPLLVGVEKIPYHLISDLVIVLEGIRCNTFQFNVFDWRNVVTELHDYLTSFAKRDSYYLSFITQELKNKVKSSPKNVLEASSSDSNNNGLLAKNKFHPSNVNKNTAGFDLSTHKNGSSIRERRLSDNLSPWTKNYKRRSPALNHSTTTDDLSQGKTGSLSDKVDGCDWHRNDPGLNHPKTENLNSNALKKNMLPNLEYTALALANENKKRLLGAPNSKGKDRNFSISCNMVPERTSDGKKSHMPTKANLIANARKLMTNIPSKNRQYDQGPQYQQQSSSTLVGKRPNTSSPVQAIEKRQKISDNPSNRDIAFRGVISEPPLEGLASPEHFLISNQAKQINNSGNNNNRVHLLEQNYSHKLSNDSILAANSTAHMQLSDNRLLNSPKTSRIMRLCPATEGTIDSQTNSMDLDNGNHKSNRTLMNRAMPDLKVETCGVPSVAGIRSTAPPVRSKVFVDNSTHSDVSADVDHKLSNSNSGLSSFEHTSVTPTEQKTRPVLSIESLAKIALQQEANKELHMPAVKINLPQIKNLTGSAQFPANLVIPFNNNNNSVQINVDSGPKQIVDSKSVSTAAKQTITIPGMVVVKKPVATIKEAGSVTNSSPAIRQGISCRRINPSSSTIIYKVPYKHHASSSPITITSPAVSAVLKNRNTTTVANASVIRKFNTQQTTNALQRVFAAHIQSGTSAADQAAAISKALKFQRCFLPPEVITNRDIKTLSSDILRRNPVGQVRLETPMIKPPTKELHKPYLSSPVTSAQNRSNSDTTSDPNVSASRNNTSRQNDFSSSEAFQSARPSVLHSGTNAPAMQQNASSCTMKYENVRREDTSAKEVKPLSATGANISCNSSPHLDAMTPLSTRVCCSPHELQPCQSCSPCNKDTISSPISSPAPGPTKVPPTKIQFGSTSPISEVKTSTDGLLSASPLVSSTKKERNKMRWQCDICNKYLSSKYILSQHKKKLHKDLPPDKLKAPPMPSPMPYTADKNSQSPFDENSISAEKSIVHQSTPNKGNETLGDKILKYFSDFVEPKPNIREEKMHLNLTATTSTTQGVGLEKASDLVNTHALHQQMNGPAVLSAQLVDEQLNNFPLGCENIEPSSELQTSWQVAGTAMRYLNDPTCDDDFFPEFPNSSLDSLSETEPSFYDNSIDALNKISYSLNESAISMEEATSETFQETGGKLSVSGNSSLLPNEASDAFTQNSVSVEEQRGISSNYSGVYTPTESNNASLFREQLSAVDLTMQSSAQSTANFSNELQSNTSSNFKKPLGTLEPQSTYDSSVSSSIPESGNQHRNILNVCAEKSKVPAIKTPRNTRPKIYGCGVCNKFLCSKDSLRRHVKVVHKILDFEISKKTNATEQTTPAPSDADESSICSSFSALDSQSEESNQGLVAAIPCLAKKGISPATNSKLSAMLLSHPIKAESTPSKLSDKLIAENKDRKDFALNLSGTSSMAMSPLANSAPNFPSECSSEAITGHGLLPDMLPDSTLLSPGHTTSPTFKKKLVVQCSMCEKSFCSSASQRRHLKNVHKCATDEVKEHERKKESEQECLEKVQSILRKITEETQKNEMLAVKKKPRSSLSTNQAKNKINLLSPGLELPGKIDPCKPSTSMHFSRTSVISPSSPSILTSNNFGIVRSQPVHENQIHNSENTSSNSRTVSTPMLPTNSKPAITPTVIVSKTTCLPQQIFIEHRNPQPGNPNMKTEIVCSLPSVLSPLSTCSPINSAIKTSGVYSAPYLHASVIQSQNLNLVPISVPQNKIVMNRLKPLLDRKVSDNQFLPQSQGYSTLLGLPNNSFLDVEDPSNTCLDLEGTVEPYLYAEDGKRNPTVENLLRYFEDMEEDVHTLQNLDEPIIGGHNPLHRQQGMTPFALPVIANALSNNWPETGKTSNSAPNEISHHASISTFMNSSITSLRQPSSSVQSKLYASLTCDDSFTDCNQTQGQQNTSTIQRNILEAEGISSERKYIDTVKSQADDVKRHVDCGDTILLNIKPSISTHLNLQESEIVSFQNRSVSVTPVEYAQSPVSSSAHQSHVNFISSETNDKNFEICEEKKVVSSPILCRMLSPNSPTASEKKVMPSIQGTKSQKRPLIRNFSTGLNSVIMQSKDSIALRESCDESRSFDRNKNTYTSPHHLNQSAIYSSNVQYQKPSPKSVNPSENMSASSPPCVSRKSESYESSDCSRKASGTISESLKAALQSASPAETKSCQLSSYQASEGDQNCNVLTAKIDQSSMAIDHRPICENSVNTSAIETQKGNILESVNVTVRDSNLSDAQNKLESYKNQQLSVNDETITKSLTLCPISLNVSENTAIPIAGSEVKTQIPDTQIIKKEPITPQKNDEIDKDSFTKEIAKVKTRKVPKQTRMLARIQVQGSPSVDNQGMCTKKSKRIKLEAHTEKRLRRRSDADNLVGKTNTAFNSPCVPSMRLGKKRALNRISKEKLTVTTDVTTPIVKSRRSRLKSNVEVKNEAKSKDAKKLSSTRIKKEPDPSLSENKPQEVESDLKLPDDAAQSTETNCPKLVLKKVPVPNSGTNKVGYYVKVKDEPIAEAVQSENASLELLNSERNFEKCRASKCVVKINRLEIEPGDLLDFHKTSDEKGTLPITSKRRTTTRTAKKTPTDISIVAVKSTKKTIAASRNKMSNCSVMLRKIETPRRLSATQKTQRPVRNVTKHIFFNEKVFMGPKQIDNSCSASPICITLD